jgi:hypothetical protein
VETLAAATDTAWHNFQLIAYGQLAAMGVPWESLQQKMQAAGVTPDPAMQRVFAASVGLPPQAFTSLFTSVVTASFATLVESLRAVGVTAAAVPVPQFYNNNRCRSVAGASEVLLVSGHSCRCGSCRTARYCSGRACQGQAWKQHKPVCQALAAARAAAAAAAAAAGGAS